MSHTAHKETQSGFADEPCHTAKHGDGKSNDDQTVVRQGQITQNLHPTTHPGRVFHTDVLRTEKAAHQLLQHEADTPGGQQCLKRATIQKTDDTAFQGRPHQGRCHEGHRHRGHQIPVEIGGQVFLENTLHHVGGIGANHHQLAVGHVDHAHQPVGDGQAQRHQQQNGP